MISEEIKVLEKADLPLPLTEIPDPPKKLYLKGTLPDPKANIFLCVVGARKYTSYGKEICETLIAGLRGYPVAVVSGLAFGIDGIAHRAALAAGLKTVAFPGSGLKDEVLYPASHRQLAREITENGGALLSEFEPNFRATPWAFPQRNRLMAGISRAVLVVEAEKKSGTLITARLAAEYNRDVLTVPGSVFARNSEGPHLLIRLGATPITSAGELLDALGFESGSEDAGERDYSDCSDEEKKLLELLSGPISRDELIARSGFAVSRANALLSILEIKGLIKESMGEVARS